MITARSEHGKVGEAEMEKTENVPFDSMPPLIIGSFLTKEQVEKLREPFKDVVSVVRCKDCKYCYFASNRVPDEQSYACEKHGIDVTPDWFCADGEMKE